MKIDILYENNDFMVVNKPSGIMVHSDGKKDVSVLTDWILEKYPEIKEVGEPMFVDGKTIYRPGIVHRLDEQTSGALIITKNQQAFDFIKKQFQDREVKKEYHAFVWGNLKEDVGVIDAAIGRNKNDFRKWQAGRGIRGEQREAITHFQLIQNFSDEKQHKFSFIRLLPLTGRTHQLRVHMAYLQRPIVSDSLYASSKEKALGFDRVALHAFGIKFKDLNGKTVSVEAPYEADFDRAIAKYISL